MAEAAQNGMYATAAVGALLLAAGAYWVLRGSGSLDPPAAGRRGLSSTEQLNFARQHFRLRFGGHFEVYDVPIIPGYGDPDAAALAALKAINPVSVDENREYGGWIFQEADGFFDYTRPVRGETARVDLAPALSEVPSGARIMGTYHTHGDYARYVGDELVRAPGPFADETLACCFSPHDIAVIRNLAHLHQLFRSYLGTPSGTFRAYDPRMEWFYTLRKGLR